MTVTKRPTNEWYTPYFAPMTIIIAITVLFLSIEVGKYFGSYSVQRDRAALLGAPVTAAVTGVHRAPLKTKVHALKLKASQSKASKTSH